MTSPSGSGRSTGELEAYGAGLAERPQIVVLNKIDLLPEPPAFGIEDPRVLAVVPVSAATGAGIDELVRALFESVPEPGPRAADSAEDELADYLVYRPRPPHRRSFRVLRSERGFVLTGRNVAALTEAEIEEALREAGARKGAEVVIGDESFELG